jgi:hypothetical protein
VAIIAAAHIIAAIVGDGVGVVAIIVVAYIIIAHIIGAIVSKPSPLLLGSC